MAEEYTPLDFQISDAELELLPPTALRLIIRKLLDHIARQDQRIKELEIEVSQLKARLDQNSSNSNKPPSSDSPYKENTPIKPTKQNPAGVRATKGTVSSLYHRQQQKSCILDLAPAAAGRFPSYVLTIPISTSSCPKLR